MYATQYDTYLHMYEQKVDSTKIHTHKMTVRCLLLCKLKYPNVMVMLNFF